MLCSIQVFNLVILLHYVFNQGRTLVLHDMFVECWESKGKIKAIYAFGSLTQKKKININWLHLGQKLEKIPVLLRGSGPNRNSRDEKSEKFQDGAWLNVKKQIL